jgi:hypothetical protein
VTPIAGRNAPRSQNGTVNNAAMDNRGTVRNGVLYPGSAANGVLPGGAPPGASTTVTPPIPP